MTPLPGRAAAILDFWFGALVGPDPYPGDKAPLWFSGGDEIDARIRDQFGADMETSLRGDHDDWAATARGRLALIVLYDQFSRNMFRDSARCFAQDPQALQLALDGIERGLDRELTLVERVFFYMPLEHSEDREIQKLSVQKFQELVDEAPDALRRHFQSFHQYAVRHAEIIERWGRYPHRNEILGRPSTPEELKFLQEPGSSF